MISASKYQHIITFMSLLKVSLRVNGKKPKDYCTWTHAGGAGVSAHPPLEKQKHFFSLYGGSFCYYFSMGRALCYVFFSYEELLLLYGGLFATFSLRGGLFCYVFLLVWGLFHNVGAFFANFFSLWGNFFVFIGDFMSLWFFYGLAPSPHDIF